MAFFFGILKTFEITKFGLKTDNWATNQNSEYSWCDWSILKGKPYYFRINFGGNRKKDIFGGIFLETMSIQIFYGFIFAV